VGVFTTTTTTSSKLTKAKLQDLIKNKKDVRNVNVSEITDMSGLFQQQLDFAQDISGWDTSNIHVQRYHISGWDISSVTNMSHMFEDAVAFDRNINWDTSSVTNMIVMFKGAVTFDRDLSTWNTSKVENMANIFDGIVDPVVPKQLGGISFESDHQQGQHFRRCHRIQHG
jgi:hypothetical protein